jgi:hypothetical protein
MIARFESHIAFAKLSLFQSTTIERGPRSIFVQFVDQKSHLALSTIVYKGDKFIPQSVREAAQSPLEEPFKDIHPWIAVHEKQFQIQLHCRVASKHIDKDKFHEAVAQFDDTAEKWRELFDEHEKRDLIHVSTTK